MSKENLARYSLGEDGTLLHWLACGPITSPLDNLDTVVSPIGSPHGKGRRWVISNAPDSLDLKSMAFQMIPRPVWQPDAIPVLGQPGPGEKGKWRYVRVEEDGVVDLGMFSYPLVWMDGWCFARLWADEALTSKAKLWSVGPAKLWLNGECREEYSGFNYVDPVLVPLSLHLERGWNDLFIHGQMLAWREARIALGLQFEAHTPIMSGIPLGTVSAQSWQSAQTALDGIVLRTTAFTGAPIKIEYRSDASSPVDVIVELSLPFPHEQAPTRSELSWGNVTASANEFHLEPGESAVIEANPELVQKLSGMPNETGLTVIFKPVDGTPYCLQRELWGRGSNFSQVSYGTYEQRCQEALEHIANLPGELMGSIAALHTGKIKVVPDSTIEGACRFLENRFDCADFHALDLLMLLYFYGDQSVVNETQQDRIETAFANFKYWIDEPGLDAMCFFTENHQILFHVCAYLAGQRWPDKVFTNSGFTGREQKQRASRRIQEWIHRRLRGLFSEWDSSSYLVMDAYALLALNEFASNKHIQSLATTLLDKLFFILASQSYRGVHGSTHGRSYAATLKSARVENTSAIQRIAWGMGNFNGECQASGMLAIGKRYQVPKIIQEIGADNDALLESQAHSYGRFRPQFDLKHQEWSINTMTHRTPYGMLSAALDYHPGKPGWQEHLWQATLGPEAVVFTTHPGNNREDGISRPNFWAGSAHMPRVGMYKNALICVYDLSLKLGLKFTHAYFPVSAFEEVYFSGQWAFGRIGKGYLALGGDGDLILTSQGRHAGQELRSSAAGQIWVCVVGDADQFGDFTSFCQNVLRKPLEFTPDGVNWLTPGGDQISFGWQHPLMVNGQQVEQSDLPHYKNRYTNTAVGEELMKINFNGQEHILDLIHGKRLT